MTTIREFYSGVPLKLKNGEELTFQQILMKDNNFLEECHNWIQWVFPTKTKSQYCPNAPVLTQEDAEWLRDNHTHSIQIALERFGAFLQSQDMDVFNHNHLRITRLIECHTLVFGENFPVVTFLSFCENFLPLKAGVGITRSELIPVLNRETFNHWKNALDATF